MIRCPSVCAIALALAGPALLGGCGDEPQADKAPPALDPAILAAIWSPLMTDPDLASLDRDARIVDAEDSARVAVPRIASGPEAAAMARAEAVRLAGGAIRPAPAALASEAAGTPRRLETAAQIAAAAGPGGAACARGIEYSARWAALLPDPLSVYPRGAVLEAAGSDRAGCALRVVRFATPVPPGEVIDFYYTRARKAGFDARHRLDGETQVLAGRKDTARYIVHARDGDDGLTEVDLVSSGA